jgi:serine phosphatase RsbU (regulator of sigma subunit)
MKPDPQSKSSAAAGTQWVRQVNEALAMLSATSDSNELARQVVEVATTRLGLAGARLWRLEKGRAVVWAEQGKLPPPNPADALKMMGPERPETTVYTTATSHWAPAVAVNGNTLAALETAGSESLSGEARSQIALFARFAGLALAHSEQKHVVEMLSIIVEATKRLNSTLDLGELINIILQLATRQTGADRGTVFLVDRERDEIWSLVGLGLAQQEIRLPSSKGIAGHVARTAETINLADAYKDPRFEPDVDRRLGYKTNSLLCLPILNKDNMVVGVIQLLNKVGGPFTSADEEFLRALSDHCALAIENAQLHRELLQKQKLERDLQLARSIQRGLLPEHPPRLEGFDIVVSHRASQMVGGDYYDFVPMGPDTLLMVIADVEGKGVASALVMANLQATLRALVMHLHSLERVVGTVNDMILADTRAQKYLSMFVGLLDQRNRTFHYINAGHVPPAVLRANGEVAYLREGGMVVGIFPGVPYERGFIRLESGDIFIGCTDGITEAMDVQSNEYGMERLVQCVGRVRTQPAEQIVEAVLADVDQFSRGGPHEDDRVIFILKVL